MSTNQGENRYSEQAKGAFTDAVEKGEFSNLSHLVSATVQTALEEAKRAVEEATAAGAQKTKEKVMQQQAQWQERVNQTPKVDLLKEWENHHKIIQEEQRKFRERMAAQQGQSAHTPTRPVTYKPNNSLAPVKRVGSVASVLYKTFGGIGLGLSTIGVCIVAPLAFAWTWIPLSTWALFYGMIRVGVSKKNRLRRVDRYIEICGNKMYAELEEIAASTSQSVRTVRRDLRRMIRDGIFVQGHLDHKETTFMLNDIVYRHYFDAMQSQKLREEENKRLASAKPTADEVVVNGVDVTGLTEDEKELNALVAQGMNCIDRLREMNDKIEGEVISEKLDKLEGILIEIFNRVKAHPEQRNSMHKMMDYYLPTTIKLVEAYEEFDRVSVPGEDILTAKAEIEKTLDTINGAFVELLNNLFQSTAFDVTTDAQVLQTMLAKEGLTKEMDFKES